LYLRRRFCELAVRAEGSYRRSIHDRSRFVVHCLYGEASIPGVAGPAIARAKIVSDVEEALDIIKANYVNGSHLNDGELTKSSVSGMLGELDPHSSYYDPLEFSELLGEQDSEYSGTGSTISNFRKTVCSRQYVVSTHPDSSAAKANLQYGDRIVAVNGLFVSGLGSDIVRDKVRGPAWKYGPVNDRACIDGKDRNDRAAARASFSTDFADLLHHPRRRRVHRSLRRLQPHDLGRIPRPH
jgi:hypothetical protein